MLLGLQATLVELRLADNLLGDNLNPIFSTTEFRGLTQLQLLDLSGNGIKAIEEGILEGCDNLKVEKLSSLRKHTFKFSYLQKLYLDRNSFSSIPSMSLNGPQFLRLLSLKNNRIGNDLISSPRLKNSSIISIF